MIHLAAVLVREPPEMVTPESWDRQLDVNLKGTFFLCRDVAALMGRHGGGSVVLIGSQGWWTGGFGNSTVYSASKGGLVSLARGLARHYGPTGVRFNVVSPGAMGSSMQGETAEETRLQLQGLTPLRRLGEPSEIAAPAVFLASDWATWMTGATLNVSGGFLSY
jgi:NAD(P)-dependent dehydrogenase (short-subunit alcohol dehydrogenase family)